VPYEPRYESNRRYLEELKAERKLAELDLYEDLAGLHAEETCHLLKARFAERYRELIGVHPDRRDELREAMERVRDGGGAEVADVIDGLR
jgi:hypothetical protein